ncbi:MAG: hypothetical protein F6K00_11490 [Leptolyngbya sp. SIOISBB]|nr:hypothetical protein [Leptolyngbya sp. SIOISBB]
MLGNEIESLALLEKLMEPRSLSLASNPMPESVVLAARCKLAKLMLLNA